jgi:hypothetical protein
MIKCYGPKGLKTVFLEIFLVLLRPCRLVHLISSLAVEPLPSFGLCFVRKVVY